MNQSESNAIFLIFISLLIAFQASLIFFGSVYNPLLLTGNPDSLTKKILEVARLRIKMIVNVTNLFDTYLYRLPTLGA